MKNQNVSYTSAYLKNNYISQPPKIRFKSYRAVLMTTVFMFPMLVEANTLPSGGEVTSGSAQITTSGSSMTINQATHKAVINWQDFSIGQGNSVTFNQPSSSSVALNRVLGSNVSVIQGALNANGQVFLVNPNGVLFSPTAQVNVGGLVASTLNLSKQDFLDGNYRFEGNDSGTITNQGNITAHNGGTIALIAGKIINNGSINAEKGNILLGAGSRVTLDLGGAVKLEVEAAELNALIENGGAIKADGGTVLLTVKAAGDLATKVINHKGIIEAQTLATNEKGEVVLLGEGGLVEVSGNINVNAATGVAGKTIVTGDNVWIKDEALLEAKGANGGGEILVGGSWQNNDKTVYQATKTAVSKNAVLDASATDNGNGGTVVVWSDVTNADSVTNVHGTIKAMGGVNGGNGGKVETSGYSLNVTSAPDVSALVGGGGLWLIDPYNISIVAGGGNTNIGTTSPFASTNNNASLGIDLIDTALGGGDVTIQTGAGGGQAGDISWEVAYDYTGGVERTLTVNAHRDIALKETISASGAGSILNMIFNADTDSNNVGGVVVTKNLTSNGGNITVNGVGTYLNGSAAQTISSSGGDIVLNGETLIGNSDGNVDIISGGGNITFGGILDGGNSYTYVGGGVFWTTAKTSAEAAGGYLATITSAIENTAAMVAANGNQFWLGGNDTNQEGVWRWVTGPEGTENGGLGRIFWTTAYGAGTTGYVGYNNQYVSWNGGEPNNASGLEHYLQGGFSDAALWNDLPITHTIGYVREKNLNGPVLTLDAGAGDVTFEGLVGNNKELDTLLITASNININGGGVKTENLQTYNGDIKLGSASTILEQTAANKDFTLKQNFGITNNNGGDADLTIKTTGSIITEQDTSIVSNTGKLNTILTASDINLDGGAINTNTGNLTLESDTLTINNAIVSGSGDLTIKALNAATTVGVGGGAGTLQVLASYFTKITDGFANIIIGRSDGTGKITSGAFTTADNVTLTNGNADIEITGLIDVGSNNVTLSSSGNITDTGAGEINAGGLLLRGAGGTHVLDNEDNDVSKLAADTGSIEYISNGAFAVDTVNTVDGITATGTVNIATKTGNLTIAQDVTTTNATNTAVIINAGKDATAGTAAGGNIIVDNSSTVTVGAGGRATLYSGSVSGSTGLTALIGSGSNKFRYNSDETASNFTEALGTGGYAVYREQPTITFKPVSIIKEFDGSSHTGGDGVTVSGIQNNDDEALAYNGAFDYEGTSQGAINAGDYTIALDQVLTSKLGYAIAYEDGKLTINRSKKVDTAVHVNQAPVVYNPPQANVTQTGSLSFVEVKSNAGSSGSGGTGGNTGSTTGSESSDNNQNENKINVSQNNAANGFMPVFVIDGGIRLPSNLSDKE